MKSLIFFAIGLLFLSTASFAAGNGQIDIRNSQGDTLWSNAEASLDIWIANDVQMGGLMIPIVISSSDGATWQWNTQSSGWGDSVYVTHNPNSRVHPPRSVFRLTNGIMVNEDFLPDSIFLGGGTFLGEGPYPGPLEHWLSIHITPSAPTDGQPHQLCLDLTQDVETTFGFGSYLGDWMTVTFLDDDNNGIWCWPVVAYIPGDANGDRQVNVGDAVYIINRIFRDGPPFNPTEAADANCDGSANVGDAVYLINHIFRDGPAPCADMK